MSARHKEEYPAPSWPRYARKMPPVAHSDAMPADADPPERRREAMPIGRALKRIMRHYKLGDSSIMDAARAAWAQLDDAKVREMARPGKYANGILYLYVRGSTELFEMRRYKLANLEKRLKAFPALREVRQVRLLVEPDFSYQSDGQ